MVLSVTGTSVGCISCLLFNKMAVLQNNTQFSESHIVAWEYSPKPYWTVWAEKAHLSKPCDGLINSQNGSINHKVASFRVGCIFSQQVEAAALLNWAEETSRYLACVYIWSYKCVYGWLWKTAHVSSTFHEQAVERVGAERLMEEHLHWFIYCTGRLQQL